MSKLATIITVRKNEILRNLCLAVLMMCIAIGHASLFVSSWSIVRSCMLIGIFVIAMLYIAATFWNIYRLIPRLLFRGKYVSYVGVLFGLAAFLSLINILFEWTILSIYRIPPGDYGYFADNGIPAFYFLSHLVYFFIALVATSLIIFLQHWWKSGERIRELEETGVSVELEKARHKIDSAALFDVLDKAASIAVSVPQEAAAMLRDLSRSLRRQLYESEQKRFFSSHTEKTTHLFQKQDRLVNFIIEDRYRRARHILLILAMCVIVSANVDPRGSFPFLEFGAFVCIFLALIYFNVYVLLSRLLFKNRITAYIVAFVILVAGLVGLLMPWDLFGEFKHVFWIFVISNIAQVGIIIAGTTAIALFQHWARNERYIAQLEEATMSAELEQLQNQINPHFLFNMLNNILTLIHENAEEAEVILHKLSDMLKYQFNDSTKKEVSLKDDIHFLTDFLNLEKIRRDRFEFTISVENGTDGVIVPPLIFIPFVENAVKHSADAANTSYIRLYFSTKGNMLHFTCYNSKPLQQRRKNEFSGLGLVNIKRRLELIYSENHSLNIQEDETTYTVHLSIKI